ncbi:hypothetical protein [Litorimonas haliclonae]|uniref:hypothetical protein n=1 Tax=Litorimonas haliclonae TaxID=2081977 RepID=UPI0039F0EF6E
MSLAAYRIMADWPLAGSIRHIEGPAFILVSYGMLKASERISDHGNDSRRY